MSWWRRLQRRDRLEGELDRELRDHVFADVECHWKWRELALLAAAKPGDS